MTLVVDAQVAGISGDMLLCALVDMGADASLVHKTAEIAQKYSQDSIRHLSLQKKTKHGISSTSMRLDIEESDAHTDAVLAVKRTADDMLSAAAPYANAVMDTLVAAESRIHGVPKDSVHLHEASSIDTILDVVGCAACMEHLGILDERVFCTPVAIGSGTISFSHGTVSNPAPAILGMLRGTGIGITAGAGDTEMTTPTGAALLCALGPEPRTSYPDMRIESVGYGGGSRDFEGFANVLKLVRGPAGEGDRTGQLHDNITILETNMDDASGEIIGYVVGRLDSAGALDVTVTPAITKKNRPANVITVMCKPGLQDAMVSILQDAGTLGVRVRRSDRIILSRSTTTITRTIRGTKFSIRYKVAGGLKKPEFDDVAKMAETLNIPISEAARLAGAP